MPVSFYRAHRHALDWMSAIDARNRGLISSGKRRLGWHWLWFLPLCLTVLLVIELHTVDYVIGILKLSYQRWTWGVLFSPSADFCAFVMIYAVWWPLLGLWLIALLVKTGDGLRTKKLVLYSVLIVVGIFLVPIIAEPLMWGSFPFNIDDQGVSRLRLIPFIPWPEGHFGEY